MKGLEPGVSTYYEDQVIRGIPRRHIWGTSGVRYDKGTWVTYKGRLAGECHMGLVGRGIAIRPGVTQGKAKEFHKA